MKQHILERKRERTGSTPWFAQRWNKRRFLSNYLQYFWVMAIGMGLYLYIDGDKAIGVRDIGVFLSTLFYVSLLPFNMSIFKRLHDTGRSGWWALLGLIPMVGSVSLLFLLLQPTEKRINKWGDCPR